MTDLLLNSPYWLIILTAILGVVVLFSGLRRQQHGVRTAGLVLVGISVLLLILRATVPTPEKKVERLARKLMTAIGNNDWTTAARLMRHAQLADWLGWEGDELAARGRQAADFYHLSGLKINSLETRREPNVITVMLSVTTFHKDVYIDSVPSIWRFEYQQRAEGWVLTRIIPVRIGCGDHAVRPEDALKLRP